MKKFIFYFFLFIYFTSCKKNYTCQCTTKFVYYSTTYNSYNSFIAEGNNFVYNQKYTEKQAKAACAHEQEAIQSSTTNWDTGNGRYTYKPGESVTTTCGIK